MTFKHATLAGLVIALLPVTAMASDRYRGRHYDRGDRYRGHSSRSHFDISIGFGSHRYRDHSFGRVSYGKHYPSYGYHRVYRSAPVVVYRQPAYYPAPVVYYPRYYYNGPACYTSSPSYYYSGSIGYYYGR